MDPHSLEYIRAQTLDKIFNKVAGKQMLSTMVATHLSIPDRTLDKLLSEETAIFQQSSSGVSRMAYGENPTIVQLTPYGEQQHDAGWSFTKQLDQDLLVKAARKKEDDNQQTFKEGKAKREKIALWIVALAGWFIATGIALFDATNDSEPDRLKKEVTQRQNKIDLLTKKYNAIPDSIRSRYNLTD